MKKIMKYILTASFAFLFCLLFAGGFGMKAEAADPTYPIYDAEDLAEVAAIGPGSNKFEGQTIRLEEDIDMNDLENTEYKGQVIRFCTAEAPFAGTFDGNGHTIKNLKNEKSVLPDTDLGLFAWTDGATIKDLTLEDPVVDCAYRGGVVVGHAKNTTIENVRVHGGKLKIQPGNNIVSLITNVGFSGGAIAGSVENSTLYNCEVRGTEVVNNSTAGVAALGGEGLYMGGIVGSASNSVIEYCRVDDGLQINEEGDYEMVETTIRNEYDVAVGALGGKAVYAGGIAGEIKSGSKIIDSYSTADVYVYCGTYVSVGAGNVAYAGGVVAEMYGGSCTVTRCHYAGNIHTKQYNAFLVIPIIENDKYISGVAQYSESKEANSGIDSSFFQRSASKTTKKFYALNDDTDTDNYKALSDEEYRDRSFWIGEDYDLYGTKTRQTDGAKGTAKDDHVNRWVMDYKRGIPIHGNSVSAAIDFPGAGKVTIDGTELIKNSMEGYPAGTDCSVSTSDAYNFAIQGYDTYEGIDLTAKVNTVKDQLKKEHEKAFKFVGWYLQRDNYKDSVTNIKEEYEAITGKKGNKVGSELSYTTAKEGEHALKDNDLYVAHYQANVVFYNVDGQEIIDWNKYYNYRSSLETPSIEAPEGCTFYGWSDLPTVDGKGYSGISNSQLTALINGDHIYQAGDLIEKPLKLYPIFTDYKNNIHTIMEGHDKDSTDDQSRRDKVGRTDVVEEDGKVYLTLTGLDESNADIEDGALAEGYRFLGWYEVVGEDEHRISTDMKYELKDVDFSADHTYKARLEYRVQYWVKAFESNVPPYYSEDGALFGEFWQMYGSGFQDIGKPDLYIETITHWGTGDYKYECEGDCENNPPTEIYDKLNVYSHSKNAGGYCDTIFISDFPGAGTTEYSGISIAISGFTVKANVNDKYHFVLWTRETANSSNEGFGNQETNQNTEWKNSVAWFSDVEKCAYGVHYTADITFHKENNDSTEDGAVQTVTRRYNDPILSNTAITYEYVYEISQTGTEITNTGAASPDSSFTNIGDKYHFIGWIDKTGLSEHELNYIYDVEGEESCTSNASKALPYIIGTDTSDGRNIVKRPMDLYPVYVKEDIVTTTNIEEAGVTAGAGINLPTRPAYTLSDQKNGLKTLTLTAYDDKDYVVGSDGAKYRLQYVEMITNPGSDSAKVERLNLTDETSGGGSYTFTLEDFALGASYKFIAYYEPLTVVYHLEDPIDNNPNVKVEVRNTGELLGTSPDPLYEEKAIDEATGGNALYSFIGWTTAEPTDQRHMYYLLTSYADKESITIVQPDDRVEHSMELFPVYAPINISVSSTIDGRLDDTGKKDTRWIERNADGEFEIHAVPTRTIGETNYVFTGWKVKIDASEIDFSAEDTVVLDEVFDGAEYIAQYSEGHTITYYYWNEEQKDYKPLYTTGVTGDRTFVTTIENPKPGSSETEQIEVPIDTEAFAGIMDSLSAGQYFDEWQWVDENGTIHGWGEFKKKPIDQDMDLYPVIWQTKVYDSNNTEMSQTASGNTPPQVYVQTGLTKERNVSVYFDGVYSEDKLTVNVGKQSYTTGENAGKFVGVENIPVSVYNQYELVEKPDAPGETEMTGDLMDSKPTDENGDAVFTFAGKLEITKKLEFNENTDESFIFKVTKLDASGNEESTTDVIVKAGKTVTMSLPYGTYKVTEDDGWAWRYTPNYETETKNPDGDVSEQNAGVDAGDLGADSGMIYINSFESSVICTNTESNSKWFDSSSNVKNVFGKAQAGQNDQNNN